VYYRNGVVQGFPGEKSICQPVAPVAQMMAAETVP
jgi:hypothetical protein